MEYFNFFNKKNLPLEKSHVTDANKLDQKSKYINISSFKDYYEKQGLFPFSCILTVKMKAVPGAVSCWCPLYGKYVFTPPPDGKPKHPCPTLSKLPLSHSG